MKACTFIRYEVNRWVLYLRYAGVPLMVWIGDYPTRGAALEAAATIDGIG